MMLLIKMNNWQLFRIQVEVKANHFKLKTIPLYHYSLKAKNYQLINYKLTK